MDRDRRNDTYWIVKLHSQNPRMPEDMSVDEILEERQSLQAFYNSIHRILTTRDDFFLTCDDDALVQFREAYFVDLLHRAEIRLFELDLFM